MFSTRHIHKYNQGIHIYKTTKPIHKGLYIVNKVIYIYLMLR